MTGKAMLLQVQIPSAAHMFARLQDDYSTAQPCLAALLDRATDINATVLLLPEGLAGKVALLQEAQVGEG